MGTVKENQTHEDFIKDFALTAKLANDTGAKALEANLSCPNIGNEGLVCYNLDVSKRIAYGIRNVIGNKPLILKLGYYKDNKQLEKMAEIANEYASGVAGINTLQAEVRDNEGNQALPGKNRLRSGVCGSGIKWAGVDFVRRFKKIKEKRNFSFKIEGVGGVTQADDYFEYKDAGADSVMSATGAMWNPYLGQEINLPAGRQGN